MNHGDRIDPINFDERISMSKIAWLIKETSNHKLNLNPLEYSKESIFANNTQKLDALRHPAVKKVVYNTTIKKENSRELAKDIGKVKEQEPFEDFKIATRKMHESMLVSLDKGETQEDQVVISASSAEVTDQSLFGSEFKIDLGKPDQILAMNEYGYSDRLDSQILDIQLDAIRPEVADVSENENSVTDLETEKTDNPSGANLENALLDQRVQSQNAIISEVETSKKQEAPSEADDDTTQAFNGTVENESTGCKDISKLKLIKPVDLINGENIHLCPTRKAWLSKNANGHGWVKMEIENHFPIIAHYPQPGSDQVLLMDDNSVALMAIKAGVQFSKESGMVMGTVPSGYRVEFSGRTDEVQYLELQSQKYFFILNVDPGAGVIELVSEKNPEEVASVFVPVVKGVISYLSLKTPESTDLKIQIQKDDSKKTDVSGLVISLSAQTQIHGITNESGLAELKKVPLISGYPIYVDSESKLNGSKSYQYRYELVTGSKDGTYRLKQFTEKSIHKWLKQYKGKLSKQSGMIIGNYSRKKLGGFKNHYFPKAVDLTNEDGNHSRTMSILWNDQLSETEPLEGDLPRFMSLQLEEGLTQLNIINDNNKIVQSTLIPVSPRVINVVSD